MPLNAISTVTPANSLEYRRAVHPRLWRAERPEIVREMIRMFAGVPRGRSGEAAELQLAVYVESVEEFSGEVIRSAVKDIIRGAAGLDPKWCPTSAEVATICRKHVARIADEVGRERRRNTPRLAEPEYRPSPEEAARIAEKARRASEALAAATEAMTMPAERKQSAAERQKAVEDIAREAVAVVAEAGLMP
jgi:hypothetical protein